MDVVLVKTGRTWAASIKRRWRLKAMERSLWRRALYPRNNENYRILCSPYGWRACRCNSSPRWLVLIRLSLFDGYPVVRTNPEPKQLTLFSYSTCAGCRNLDWCFAAAAADSISLYMNTITGTLYSTLNTLYTHIVKACAAFHN
jgi:hypothetical protein